MPPVSCSRCFRIFDADDARAGAPPLCPACAPTPSVDTGGAQALADSVIASAGPALAAAAQCEVILGHTVAAERLARQAMAAAPRRSLPLAVLAEVALARGKPRDALGYGGAAVQLRAADAVALEVRARALEGLGRRPDALRAHQQALHALPDLATARLAAARLLARLGRAAAARAALEALVHDDPAVGEGRGELAALGPPARP